MAMNTQGNEVSILSVLKDILPSVCTVLVAVISSFMLYRASFREKHVKMAEDKRKILDSFYYPFLLRSRQNALLRKTFNDECALLPKILEGLDFDKNDKAIIDEIKNNDKILNELILSHNTVIYNKEVRTYLAQLSAHYTMFILACDGKLSGDPKRFNEYTYPIEVTNIIEEEIIKIEEEISNLLK
jgi:hypothetical protein